MYKIGEFSLLNRVSIKTLRYYDKIGLLKPEKVDPFTGYRYYTEDQQDTFYKIQRYKELGFSLTDIHTLLQNHDEETIHKKINSLVQENMANEKKIRSLKSLLKKEVRVEYKPYPEKRKVGRRVTLKDREDLDTYWKEIKEELSKRDLSIGRRVFCNFELGYVEENIDGFVGYELLEDVREVEGFEVILTSKMEKQLVGLGTVEERNNIYEDMVKYAKEDNIQIRGFFEEFYQNDNVEIIVEAFDLKEPNEDYEFYLAHHTPTKELDEELVGTYVIREILPDLKYMFNKEKQKSMLDTKYKELILKEDGTTNDPNIHWNKKELILTYENENIPLPIHKKENYLVVLMNENYDNYKMQRPMEYLYEKNKNTL